MEKSSMTNLQQVRENFIENISKINLYFNSQDEGIKILREIEKIRVEYLGKNGYINHLMTSISSITDINQKKIFGQQLNELKIECNEQIKSFNETIKNTLMKMKLVSEKIDITLPPRGYEAGSIHPITKMMQELKMAGLKLGFEMVSGPQIETDWYNFTALNIDEHHPARQNHDTFYCNIDGMLEQYLLRTHTSSVQIRYMESHKDIPIRIFSLGNVYRKDLDATHTPMFHQLEGLCIDKDLSIAQLRWCLEQLLALIFEKDIEIRMRPSYFPFTTPSIEIDVRCDMSNPKKIKVGTGNDWLEILGAGMVHPKVLANVGLQEYSGFAFGVGIERLAMLKYTVPDVRYFYCGDLRRSGHNKFRP